MSKTIQKQNLLFQKKITQNFATIFHTLIFLHSAETCVQELREFWLLREIKQKKEHEVSKVSPSGRDVSNQWLRSFRQTEYKAHKQNRCDIHHMSGRWREKEIKRDGGCFLIMMFCKTSAPAEIHPIRLAQVSIVVGTKRATHPRTPQQNLFPVEWNAMLGRFKQLVATHICLTQDKGILPSLGGVA